MDVFGIQWKTIKAIDLIQKRRMYNMRRKKIGRRVIVARVNNHL